ncbi:iron permease [Methylosinus sporium]|uniref:Iron permease n=1 Tax=Methylosinus sporium TaxID=428 RepID=A0A549SWC4_METSR|nr:MULTISPECIES: FTR1 family protein [Methylosinus]MBU3888408.1 FTR1 family protein [Methylosinus sp. KRF6]TRL33925.1 iron permease [Methylosinus sporium]
MLGALVIVFREVIEAGLVIGIVLAVTQGARGSRTVVFAGVVAGALGAGLVALFADALSQAVAGRGQELFNAAVLAVAVVMLAWHNIWMARHGRELASELAAAGRAAVSGDKSFFGLALVVALAVLREGSEVALFLYGLLVSGESGADVILGGFSGLVLGAGVSALTYFGLVTIPARHLFAVTTAMITLLAAGLAAQCAAFLQQAWIVTALSQTMWDTSGVLPDTSLVGRVLHTLIGYVDQPTALQVVVYVATLAGIFLATRLAAPRPGAANVHAAAE